MTKIEEFLSSKGRLLEIGSSFGTLLNKIRKSGWEVTGIEPRDHACEIARSKYGLNVINSTFQEAGIKDYSFDVVLLLHVIEHLPNPAEGLSQICKMIRPGGLLVLETPRYDTLWFKLLKRRERSVIKDHKYYFTRRTIRALVTHRSEFEVLQLDSVGRTVTLDRLCYYAAKFIKSKHAARLITSVSKGLHLNKVHLHINLHDMMRLYLKKIN